MIVKSLERSEWRSIERCCVRCGSFVKGEHSICNWSFHYRPPQLFIRPLFVTKDLFAATLFFRRTTGPRVCSERCSEEVNDDIMLM